MMFGLVTRRRYDAELAALRSQYEALRERCEGAESREAIERNARRTITHQFTEADEQRTALALVNACVTDDLTAARERLAEFGARRTVSEVLVEHDVHRKALAGAVESGLHLNWEQLIETARRTFEGACDWRADFEAEKKRADQLQARLDDACSLDDPRVKDGRYWQQTRTDVARKSGAEA